MAEQQNEGEEKAVEYTALKPILEAPETTDAIRFYKAAIGAEMAYPVRHTLNAEREPRPGLSTELHLSGTSFLLHDRIDVSSPARSVLLLETEDFDAAIAKAVRAGGVLEGQIIEVVGSSSGARLGKIRDPYGFLWLISSTFNK